MNVSLQLTEQEKKDKRVALIVSIAVHALLLLLFYFLLAWTPQIPPPPEYGIELNFGLSSVGSGDVQTQATPNESQNREDSKPASQQPVTPEEPQPEPTKAVAAPIADQKVVTTEEPSPVAVKEEPKTKPKPEPKEEVREPEKPKALFPGKTPDNSAGTGVKGTSNKPTGNSQGDDDGAVGDKGDPKGTVDAKNLYGNPGRGSGGDLDMPGWRWDNIPKPNDQSNENGKLVFEVKIDEDGEIMSIRRVEGTVSAAVERVYRAEVEKLTFSRTGPKPAGATGTTVGRITFRIQSR